jgi:hypothetical protein
MNHPKPEEWAPFVCGESKPDQQRRLSEHLSDCSTCREVVDSWKRSLGRLDSWELNRAQKLRTPSSPFFKLAAAAALVLAVGFGVGRFYSTAAGVEKVRAAIEPELKQQLRRELDMELQTQIKQLEAQRLADYIELKKQLDTVAVLTDAGLRQTQERLVELAGYTEAAVSPGNSTKP